MNNFSNFDDLGPVMIGPSGRHTVGAIRLGKIAREIGGPGFSEVEFILHGSFAMTYKIHGTDKSLVAGVLGMDLDDENIINSFDLAKNKKIEIIFSSEDLGDEHPNTVQIILRYEDKEDFYIIGSSLGEGNILITDINGNQVEFTGDKPTILLKYGDRKGVISEVSSILAKAELNIATMRVSRYKDIATMICEIDTQPNENIINKILNLKGTIYSKFIKPVAR